MPHQKRPIGPKPGSGRSANAKKNQMDANIRDIFEQEARQSDALRKAIRYMFENEPVTAVHAYLKLLSTQQTTSPINNVTNVFAEQINAPRIVQHLEELATFTEGAIDASSLQNESVLLVDDRSKAN